MLLCSRPFIGCELHRDLLSRVSCDAKLINWLGRALASRLHGLRRSSGPPTSGQHCALLLRRRPRRRPRRGGLVTRRHLEAAVGTAPISAQPWPQAGGVEAVRARQRQQDIARLPSARTAMSERPAPSYAPLTTAQPQKQPHRHAGDAGDRHRYSILTQMQPRGRDRSKPLLLLQIRNNRPPNSREQILPR